MFIYNNTLCGGTTAPLCEVLTSTADVSMFIQEKTTVFVPVGGIITFWEPILTAITLSQQLLAENFP